MSYRCSICDAKVSHNKQMKRFIIKRLNGQIEREIPVCLDCDAGLRSGYTPDEVRSAVAATATKVSTNHKPKPKTESINTEDLPPYNIGDKA